MKKLLLALMLLSGGAAHAQITLEHRYAGASTNNFAISKFSNGELKYITVGAGATPVVTVYNENHSVMKQMAAPAVLNGIFQGIYLVSDKLFNQDAAIEYVCGYTVTAGNSTIYRLLALSETGQQLLVADTATYYNAARVVSGTSGIKLIIPTSRLDASGNSIGSYTKVYALGGTAIPLAAKAEAANSALPYPNPTQSRITLPYEVASGQLATLQIIDIAGRTVKQYTVSSAFKSLELGVDDLETGTYAYRLVSNAGVVTRGNKFIVN
jgi:hypothetical protein